MTKNFDHLIGCRFGRLTVSEILLPKVGRKCVCICDCGSIASPRINDIRHGHIKSCGCLNRELYVAGKRTTHGEAGALTAEYRIWSQIKKRCMNPKVPEYRNYGGRGIQVCERWKESFQSFLADVGRRPTKDHQLDRINNDGHYEPANMRWATRSEQNRNKRTAHLVTAFGQTLNVAAWVEKTGLSDTAITCRLKRGWSPERAVTEPSLTKGRPRSN